MDIQECPAADLAVVSLVVEIIKALTAGKFVDYEAQIKWKTEPLAQLLDQTTEKAQDAMITNGDYLALFGFAHNAARASELWEHILQRMTSHGNSIQNWKSQLDIIIQQGSLASRIVKSIGQVPSKESIVETYKKLSTCLAQNTMFLP